MQENTNVINKVSYDYEPLNQKVAFAQLFSLIKQDLANKILYVLLTFMVLGVFILFAVGIIVFSIIFNLEMTTILLCLFFIIVFIVNAFLYVYSYSHKLVLKYKMSLFAKANSIGFINSKDDPSYNGLIFDMGHSKIINYAYVFNNYSLQIGSYSYTTGYGKNSRKYTYGYVVFDLPRNVPHMLLDSKRNNFMGFSNLPTSFSSNQKLVLEGDFNEYFTLYAPKEYEKDALYIFTPDVMQAVVKYADSYDIEIISNKLYIYNKKEFNLTDKNNIEQLLKIINILSGQFYDQTHYYADETIGNRAANIVNDKGKQLDKSYMSYLPTIIGIILSIIGLFIWFSYGSF